MKRPNILDGKYFVLAKRWSNGKVVATCRFCHMDVSAHIARTSNLLKHIRRQHHEFIEECLVHCNRRKSYYNTASNKTERDLGKVSVDIRYQKVSKIGVVVSRFAN